MNQTGLARNMPPVSHNHLPDTATEPAVRMAAAQVITPAATQVVPPQAGPPAIQVTSLSGSVAADRQSTPSTSTTTASPLPGGILFKGKRHRKRVSFRDSNLCNIREIPPRSSSPDDDSDYDDDDASDSSDSDGESDSDEEEEENVEAVPAAAAVPARQPVVAVPAKQPVVAVPGKQSAVTIPVKQSAVTMPVKQLAVTIPVKQSAVTIPVKQSAVTMPVKQSTVTMPVKQSAVTVPGKQSVAAVPAKQSTVAVAAKLSVTGGSTKQPDTGVAGKEKAASFSLSRASPAAPVSTLTVRPERAPIPWSNTHSYTVAKGSYDVSSSPASKVASLVSQITGVSPATIATRPRPRSCPPPSTSSSFSTPKAVSPTPGKRSPGPVRVEKKTKKISPTMDNVISSQSGRSVQKHGVTDSLHRASTSPKPGKKKRVLQRRQEGSDKRKTSASRKTKDSKQANKVNAATVSSNKQTSGRVTSASTKSKSGGNGLANVRDSLSLPPLSRDDSALLTPARLPAQHRTPPKTPVYSSDSSLFHADSAPDLATGVKVAASLQSGGGEEVRLKPQGPAASSLVLGGQQVRDRVSSAPPLSTANRRKRFYAWQMANGNLQNSLHEPPSITPMWETISSVAPSNPKPAFVVDR